jgi:tetratricopeptide (TPR) repeat protein
MSRRPPKPPKESPKDPKSAKGVAPAAPRPRARFAKTQVGGGAKVPPNLGKTSPTAAPEESDALLDELFTDAPAASSKDAAPRSNDTASRTKGGRSTAQRSLPSSPPDAPKQRSKRSPARDEEEERETLMFHRALASSEPVDDAVESAYPEDEAPTRAPSDWQWQSPDTAALDPSVFDPASAAPPAVVEPDPMDVLDLTPSLSEGTAALAVRALPPDRGSTEELDLDDVELVGDVADLFDPLAVGMSAPAPAVAIPPAAVPVPVAVDDDDHDALPTLMPPGMPSDDEGTAALPRVTGAVGASPDSGADFSQRGVYPRIRLPELLAEGAAPPPAPSIPIALVPPPTGEDAFEILVDELEYVDGPAPPSRSSLVAARQSVAGWLASSAPPVDLDADEFVFGFDDAVDSSAAAESVKIPVRDPLALFVEPGAEPEAAVVALVERGVRTEWVDRARRMLAEAPTGNAAARASYLLVVSEQFAIAGEMDDAEQIAAEALTLAPASPIMQRQLRGILASKRAWPQVVEQLGRELRTAPTPASRAHAGLLASEVARTALGDVEGAKRMLDRAIAADPEDMRGPIARWVLQASDRDASLDAPQGPHAQPFAAASAELAALRSNGAEGAQASSSFGRLLAARAGLRRRDAKTAVSVLGELSREPALSGAASWLGAVIGAPYAELSTNVDRALREAGAGTHRRLAQRSLVAHALERADVGTVASAIRGGDALAPVDRLFLAALLGAGDDLPEPDLLLADALDGAANERSLVTASAALLGAVVPLEDASGDLHGRLRSTLARALASLRRGVSHSQTMMRLGAIVDALIEHEPEDGAGRAWSLERQLVEGNLVRLVESVPGGPRDQRVLALALASELSRGSVSTPALEALARTDVAALRILTAHVPPATAATAFEARAAAIDDAAAALLLTEAACRLSYDVARADALWVRAHDRNPDWPVAPLFAFASAVRNGDVSKARHWLDRCNLEPLHQQVLIGLRLAARGSDERREALAAAHRMRPSDVVLREQLELAGGSTADRARWLEEQFEARGGREPKLALEAALLHEVDGDLESASRSVGGAQVGATFVGDLISRRLARSGHGARQAIERLESASFRVEAPADRVELLVESARIASHGLRDRGEAARRFRDAVEAGLTDVMTLVEAEQRCFDVLGPSSHARVEFALARAVQDPAHAVGHAMLATRAALRAGELVQAYDAAQFASQVGRRGSWALRKIVALSHARRDDDAHWRAASELAGRTTHPLERAALLCRAAEAALAAGDNASAATLLADVFKAWPRHPVARLVRATLLERSGALVEAAIAFEELAGMSRSRKDRAQRVFKAATLWLGSNDPRATAEGRRLLEAACDLDPENASAFERLQSLYVAGGARLELAELLSQRARGVTDPKERGALEGMRGRMLAEAGASTEAKAALAASLKVRPDDVEAWRAYADVSLAEQDGESAEQALLQLGRLVTEAKARAEVFLKLGDVYARLKPNLDRAARAYREAEKLDPERIEVRERLIELQAARGDRVGALAAQRTLVDRAATAVERAARLVALSWLEERLGDLAEAERILVELRRHQPAEARSIKALHGYYLRHGKRALADALLERTPAELARLLVAGRTEDGVFDALVAMAELRGRSDGVAVARTIRTAAHGGAGRLGGAGARGAHPSLDDLVAPEVFSAELRELLAATGHALDGATPFDGLGLRTRPLSVADPSVTRAREIASAHGLSSVDLVVANTLSPTIVPVSVSPVVLCVGAPLLAPAQRAQFELCVHRALTLVRTRTAALARTAPIDEGPVLAAYLRLHDPSLSVEGVDAGRLEELMARMRAHAPDLKVDARLASLARRAFESLGARHPALGASAVAWSWHVATLCVGDLGLVFDAMGYTTSSVGAPAREAERLRWLGKHLEARELLAFLVSVPHLEGRARLGLLVPP